LEYYGGGAEQRPVWEAAPRRCIGLAVAWAVTLLALFLPGCDFAGRGNRSEVRPTYTVYLLTGEYTLMIGSGLYDAARRPGAKADLPTGSAMWIACPLFLLGSAVFLLTPRLLARRVRRKLGRLDWCLLPLLLAPWFLLAAAAVSDDAGRFLYGFHLLAAGHTAALVVIVWPLGPPVARGHT
jgi:hypothetical protein